LTIHGRLVLVDKPGVRMSKRALARKHEDLRISGDFRHHHYPGGPLQLKTESSPTSCLAFWPLFWCVFSLALI